ncbi:hypothetical protein LZ32DRAFT_663790 [Colletotrichum eremochloae]|nr:hypothetical protein LZ32DRAFT_663790 [Colletotrichum eremochloae]
MASCCPTNNHEGNGSLGDSVFTYACNKYANSYDPTPKQASTPRECAQICSEDSSCIAGTWYASKGHCYITYKGSSFVPMSTPNYILITKVQDMGDGDPPQTKPDDSARCIAEKDNIRSQMKNECETKVMSLESTHQDELSRFKDRCEAAEAILRQDKAQCEMDKKKISEARDQCQAAKSDLEKQLKKCRAKTEGGQTGDVECKSISYGSCSPGCRRFAINGVEYENRCGRATLITKQAVTEPNDYGSIQECLEKRCNSDPLCMGVGWINGQRRCHFHYPHPSRTPMQNSPNIAHHLVIKVGWRQP